MGLAACRQVMNAWLKVFAKVGLFLVTDWFAYRFAALLVGVRVEELTVPADVEIAAAGRTGVAEEDFIFGIFGFAEITWHRHSLSRSY